MIFNIYTQTVIYILDNAYSWFVGKDVQAPYKIFWFKIVYLWLWVAKKNRRFSDYNNFYSSLTYYYQWELQARIFPNCTSAHTRIFLQCIDTLISSILSFLHTRIWNVKLMTKLRCQFIIRIVHSFIPGSFHSKFSAFW